MKQILLAALAALAVTVSTLASDVPARGAPPGNDH